MKTAMKAAVKKPHPKAARPAPKTKAPEGALRLKIGQSISINVPAKAFWHNTNVFAEAGEEYQFSASGIWIDAYIPCGPDGYPSIIRVKSLEAMRRMPDANWFALVGCLDQNMKHAFLIGRKAQVKMPDHGMICCFANDVPWAYWNNWGELTLKITRTK